MLVPTYDLSCFIQQPMGSKSLNMNPRLIIALLASVASISAASILFLHAPSHAFSKRSAPQPTIEVKWGEGSEAGVPEPATSPTTRGEPSQAEETYVFAGTCANGESYRMVSYQKVKSGSSYSYYDYSGPAGTGTVQSETQPKVMAVRVCRKAAEIISAHYWESH